MRLAKTAMALAALMLTSAAAPAERIAGEISSWGRVQNGWQISAGGEALLAVREGSDFNDYYLVTRRARVGAKGFRTIAGLVKPLRRMVGVKPRCKPAPTDGPYGAVTWTEAGKPVRFDFNSYCASRQTDKGFARNELARAQIGRWAANGEIVARKWMGAPEREPK